MKHLIDLLIHSSEQILGPILKLWGRAEFQTLDGGDSQHYHFLFWLVEDIFDSFWFIQCCKKHILHSLLKIADSSLLIEDEVHLYQLYDECVRFNTHNCDIHGGRCKKRKDLKGNKICRSPTSLHLAVIGLCPMKHNTRMRP